MLWDDAIYRLTYEMRRIKINSQTESTGINGDISHFIDRGYVNLQATAIRSLIDKREDVISIPRIIKDLTKNIGLITRENYVCYDDVKFNPKENATDNKEINCNARHKSFDKLCGGQDNQKKRNDLINPKTFSKLTEELNKCNDIKEFTNKFIAHKADTSSLENLTDEQLGITLDQITKCHQAILGVASFIDGHILGKYELGGIPTEQYGLFKELDKPWITEEDFDGLWEFWHTHKETIEKMLNYKP
ncbi:MAG: hypothetical protein H8E42_02210 [Nitrospinae bacterium]|nr:hypothetical protein [Nitrospinota bacterium]MBL7019547.1 hypothetical protein [Nitrospinaceae bacterium]